MKFSDRIGITKVNNIIQVDEINASLRNSIWNCFYLYYSQVLAYRQPESDEAKAFNSIFTNFWWNTLTRSIDSQPNHENLKLNIIKEFCFSCKWWELYNFLESIIDYAALPRRDNFIFTLNATLESQLSGFRVVDYKVTPITSEIETAEIQKAIDSSVTTTFKGVSLHIKDALAKLSEKPTPDYRNSIKESISAVESICRELTGDKDEFSKMLALLKTKLDVHPGLISGFKSIYGYSSDKEGIRHAMMDLPNLKQEDAIYMLVSCSAFINYLISKSVAHKADQVN